METDLAREKLLFKILFIKLATPTYCHIAAYVCCWHWLNIDCTNLETYLSSTLPLF